LITFEEITYKNFLSTGNTGQTLFLSRTPSALITGVNGAGKSTMLDALCFAIFNKPYRTIAKSQLVNTVNEKGLEVKLKLKVNKTPYTIIRGVKPNFFEIYKEDKLITQDASLRDYQQKLEEIIGLNYKSFTQIVILGSARYQSFMDLANWERRGIIEEILDITVFSRMNIVLKSRVTSLEDSVRDTEHKKSVIQTKISAQNGLIENINARSRESTDKIENEETRTRAEIDLCRIKNTAYDSDIDELLSKVINEDINKEKLKQGEYQL
jgi:DNA repair exonuclease SbcCD ATPase subunit